MDVHQLGREDFEQAYDLGCYAFQVTDKEEQREKAKRAWDQAHAAHFALKHRDTIQAKLTLLSLKVNLHGRTVPMGGIASVASYPEGRRQGHVKHLLHHALYTMKENGQLLSYLAPFSVPFYRKYGWEIFCDEVSFELTEKQLPKPAPVYDGIIERVSFNDPRIRTLYQHQCSHGMLVREDFWWRNLAEKYASFHTALYTDDSGTPAAYMVYQVKENKLEVNELIYNDIAALEAIFSFIGQHDSMIQSASIPATGADTLHYFLPDPHTKAEVSPYFMARIVDVEALCLFFRLQARVILPLRLRTNLQSGTIRPSPYWLMEIILAVHDPKTLLNQSNNRNVNRLIARLSSPSFYLKSGQITGDAKAIASFCRFIPNNEPGLIDFF
ncbi:LOW QUALITY PROTEIN: acetyltransferase [Bacillus sp. JCM 19046]|nr:LOW QUALITY PROTEIN: acetyltransferase [Bacillus sp. JCM 19046]